MDAPVTTDAQGQTVGDQEYHVRATRASVFHSRTMSTAAPDIVTMIAVWLGQNADLS